MRNELPEWMAGLVVETWLTGQSAPELGIDHPLHGDEPSLVPLVLVDWMRHHGVVVPSEHRASTGHMASWLVRTGPLYFGAADFHDEVALAMTLAANGALARWRRLTQARDEPQEPPPMREVAFADALAREAALLPLLRACTPEETSLTAIAPALPEFGITRAASITHLDTLGIPIWVSVRPGARVLQISNGKGVTDAASKVSALMEACEPASGRESRIRHGFWLGSMAQLAKVEPGARIVVPSELPGHLGLYFTPDFAAEWTMGTNMGTGDRVYVPSSAVYFSRRPALFNTSSNGTGIG